MLALAIAVVLAGVHVIAGRLRFLEGVPRSRWLSLAGGVSVAYVFIHILPELAAGQEEVEAANVLGVRFVEHHVYLVALLGLAIFYGLERMARRSRGGKEDARPAADPQVFRLHMGSFALYNLLVGYLLLHREEETAQSLLLFGIAMALHFVVNDFGLREHFRDDYDHLGRWLLAASVLAGWLLGLALDLHEAAVAVLFAFLAGGVVLNVLKEELPEERQARFLPFAGGVVAYTAVLLLAS